MQIIVKYQRCLLIFEIEILGISRIKCALDVDSMLIKIIYINRN